jgi:hypothetical protein
MANNSKETTIKCFHCGNETLMHKKGEHEWGSRDIETDENNDFSFSYQYEMYACPVCHKVTLIQKYIDETMWPPSYGNARGDQEEKTILYPINSIESDAIPAIIKGAFEGAQKTKSIDNNVCLMALRRTLELIMNDRGATSRNLMKKIEEIAEKGMLPDALKEASGITRILGNSAAHGMADGIDQDDVNRMVELIEYIIEYLYVIPDKISRYKKKLDSKLEADNK